MNFKFQYPSTFNCQRDHEISHQIYNSSFNCLMTSYISFIGQLYNAYMHKVPQGPCGSNSHLMFFWFVQILHFKLWQKRNSYIKCNFNFYLFIKLASRVGKINIVYFKVTCLNVMLVCMFFLVNLNMIHLCMWQIMQVQRWVSKDERRIFQGYPHNGKKKKFGNKMLKLSSMM